MNCHYFIFNGGSDILDMTSISGSDRCLPVSLVPFKLAQTFNFASAVIQCLFNAKALQSSVKLLCYHYRNGCFCKVSLLGFMVSCYACTLFLLPRHCQHFVDTSIKSSGIWALTHWTMNCYGVLSAQALSLYCSKQICTATTIELSLHARREKLNYSH